MTAKEILAELKTFGNENIKRIYINHGGPANQYGVKVEDMKKIQKKIKKDYKLSLELYDSGISDAQYLAGLIADETKMTRKDLEHWAEYAHGWELGLKWIDSKKENIQSSGWSTLSNIIGIKQYKELDSGELKKLL